MSIQPTCSRRRIPSNPLLLIRDNRRMRDGTYWVCSVCLCGGRQRRKHWLPPEGRLDTRLSIAAIWKNPACLYKSERFAWCACVFSAFCRAHLFFSLMSPFYGIATVRHFNQSRFPGIQSRSIKYLQSAQKFPSDQSPRNAHACSAGSQTAMCNLDS